MNSMINKVKHDIDGIKINTIIVRADKNDPVIVFIPGMGCYSELYLDFLMNLCSKGFSIIAIDLEGHGRSDGIRGRFNFGTNIEVIGKIVDYAYKNFSPQIGIMGSSLGGTYALYAGIQHEKIKAVLCHCAMDVSIDLYIPTRFRRTIRNLMKTKTIAAPIGFLPVSLKLLVRWDDVVDGNEKLLRNLKRDEKMVWSYRLSSWISFIEYGEKVKLKSPQKPIKVVVGEYDKLFPVNYEIELASRIGGNIFTEIVKNGGHFLPFNNEEEIVEIAKKWFSVKNLTTASA